MTGNTVMDALAEQARCYRRLAELAQLQHEYVRQNQTEQLLDVLRERQETVCCLADFERDVAPARRRWSDYLSGLDCATRAKAVAILAETQRLLRQIIDADRDDALLLRQQKLNFGRQAKVAAPRVKLNYATAEYGRPKSLVDVQR